MSIGVGFKKNEAALLTTIQKKSLRFLELM